MQLVRYYGWYSNKSRGLRAKQQELGQAEVSSQEVINVSSYVPPKVPNKQWRALIQKIWEVDPLECPGCGGEMRIISFIQEKEVIEKILRHIKLWPKAENAQVRGSPEEQAQEIKYELYYDDLPCQPEEELVSG